ncbi:sulfurtransferase TusA family protein [Streptomyces sp. NPDC056352]|uniref:sulfurtransferase TusA family protein n=1 Tax=Streptomyces sp. NPDC056352 TaxID=3345791 RepID=UPI0035DFE54C
MLDPARPIPGRSVTTVIVDAGGEPWERVEPLLARRMDELTPGAALELLSTEPRVCDPLSQWCAMRGHALTRGATNDEASRFRIRKHGLSPLEQI